ncbi:MFS transporter [Ktedonospora formicarum]|uniref:Major facilitator superfamily (MFS) profile domain-containing protein n=1 Tax=Ktedonospora formicarum TaxID=2778364 RepID=A0A8J3I4B7_9CHLR|nr:MFS transporter [Ktedonospora formicarum]GHO44589.1 hypothetical protein KSX_27520 [Ktedonospora formicarum]
MYTLEDDHDASAFKRKQATRKEEDAMQPSAPNAQKATENTDISEMPTNVTVTDVRPHTTEEQDTPSTVREQISQSLHQLAPEGPHRRIAIAALTIACIGVFITALDETVVVTALPQIITDLHLSLTQLDHASWIVSAYLLGFVVAMPLMGRVSDIYGRRRIFQICLTIFGLGSFFCAIAPWLGASLNLSFLRPLGVDTSSPGLIWLIAARFFQAIGGGALVPVAMAIAGDFYTQKRLGIALGIIGAVTEIGGALGPLYGALLVEHFGWQSIFYLNIPIVVALMVGTWLCIPRGQHLREGVDWLGSLLLGLALTCLSLGLAQQGAELGTRHTSASPAPQNNPIVLALAVIFFVAFVLVERKVRWPVVDLSLFKRFTFSASTLVSLLVGAALIIAMADIPIYIDTVMQLTVMDSGLALLRMTALIPVGALLGGWLCNHITCRWTAVLGLLFTAVGFYLMSRWPIDVSWTQITISTMTAGLGFGLVISPIGTTALNAVKAKQAGMSSAVITALRMVGMILGLAILTSWALADFNRRIQGYPALGKNTTAGDYIIWMQNYAVHLVRSAHTVYTSVFFATMILCVIALIPAFFLWGNQTPLSEQEAELTPAVIPGKSFFAQPRQVLAAGSILLVMLLIAGGILATFMVDGQALGLPKSKPTLRSITLQVGLDQQAITSLLASQLKVQESTLSDVSVTPLPNDGLKLSLKLHIDTNGIKRVMPVEMEGKLALDSKQNVRLNVTHVRRDGKDAGKQTAKDMQAPVDEMFTKSVMPALHAQLKSVKIREVHTTTTLGCSQGKMVLLIKLETPAVEDLPNIAPPAPYCLLGPININDINKLPPELPTP